MKSLINIVYYLGWIACAALFHAVAYNRYTSGALGLFDVYDLNPERALQVVQAGVVVLLIQTMAIIIRITDWRRARILEIALALLAWLPFLYNLSFVRG